MRRVALFASLALLTLLSSACFGVKPSNDLDNAIEVFGPYRDGEADNFKDVLHQFTRDTGIDVRYVGSLNFATDIANRVVENDPPDLAVVPQPGLVRKFASEDIIVPLSEDILTEVQANYTAEGQRLGEVDGVAYSIPFRLVIKSLVWYRPDVFEKNGWEIPQTLDDLEALGARIKEDTDLAPWCFGLNAGLSSGWAATDWVEDLALRMLGTADYGRWATGELEFADPSVQQVFDKFRALVLAPGQVLGGLASVIATPVTEAISPLFADPPGCAMYKQADFAIGWMPEGTSIGPDGDVNWFPLPGSNEGEPAPLLIGGDQIIQFNPDDRVDRLMAYLAGPVAGTTWAKRSGFLSPKSSISEDAYPSDYLRALRDLFAGANTAAFDASDLMPPQIGSDLFWEKITEWVGGSLPYTTLASDLDTAFEAQRELDAAR